MMTKVLTTIAGLAAGLAVTLALTQRSSREPICDALDSERATSTIASGEALRSSDPSRAPKLMPAAGPSLSRDPREPGYSSVKLLRAGLDAQEIFNNEPRDV